MRAALERDGFVLIRGIVPPELLRDVQGVVEAAVEQRASDLLERGLVSSTHAGEPFETRWQAVVDESGAMQARRSWDEDLISPQFHRLCSAPALTDALQSMLGSESDSSEGAPRVYCTGNFSLRPKIPNDKRTTIKWHNDSMYSRNYDDLVLTCWLPLVPADEVNGCMQVRPPQGTTPAGNSWLLTRLVWAGTPAESPARPGRQPHGPGVQGAPAAPGLRLRRAAAAHLLPDGARRRPHLHQ